MRPRRCSVCRSELRAHERPEGVCDSCLRAAQVTPLLAPTEPQTLSAGPERLSFAAAVTPHDDGQGAAGPTSRRPDAKQPPPLPDLNGTDDPEVADEIVRDLLKGVDL